MKGARLYLAGASDTKCRNQGIGAVAAMGSQDALDERGNACTMEDIELRCLFLEDTRKGKLLRRAFAVVGWVEGDVGRMGALVGLFDTQEPVG